MQRKCSCRHESVYIVHIPPYIKKMRAPTWYIAILAAATIVCLIIPASAGHGGGSGSSSSAGGYGQAATAETGSGGWSGSPGSGPGPGSGEPSSHAISNSGTRGSPAAPGAGTGQQAEIQGSGGRPEMQPGSLREIWDGGVRVGQSGLTQAASGNRDLPGSPYGQHPGPPAQAAQPYGPGTQAGRYPCGPAQAADTNAGTPAHPEESKSRASQRVKRDDEEPPLSTGEAAAGPFPHPALFFPFLGYRRISARNVLSHDSRVRVYSAIAAHPGIDTLTLAEMVEMNRNTLRYHLFTLLRTGRITAFSRPGVVRYYQNQGMYPPYLQCLLHYLWTGTPREIISLLSAAPGMTRTQLADALSFSGPSVTRHIRNLSDDGIIDTVVKGRSHHYSLTPAALTALDSFRERETVPGVHGMGAPALPTLA